WDGTNNFGGGATNSGGPFLLQSFGAGNDLTISNTFTLIGTNAYYTINYINPTNIPPDNPGSGMGAGGNCTNRNGPYYPSPLWGPDAFTNACGYILFAYDAGTNSANRVTSIW